MNDVARMKTVLGDLGFNITECSDAHATRNEILQAWRNVIDSASQDDIIVIYYSGHGGLVEAPHITSGIHRHWRYQFIVPRDFDTPSDDGFQGILDVELSLLLKETTDKTHNVTIVFDCCHSGRMSRSPSFGGHAVPRQLPGVCFRDISTYLARLKKEYRLDGHLDPRGNPYAVRVAAAATAETAWERETDRGYSGVMTDALCQALQEAKDENVSWKTTMLRISERVGLEFPRQHPQVEGPSTRLLFSLQHAFSGALTIRMQNDVPIIQAGRVLGIRVGNIYTVMPFGTDVPSADAQIGTAIVTKVRGFKTLAEVTYSVGKSIPSEGALAFLEQEALPRWPVDCTVGFETLKRAIEQSRYIRPLDPEEDTSPLLSIDRTGKVVRLLTDGDVPLVSKLVDAVSTTNESLRAEDCDELVKAAETRARAQHLQTLQCEDPKEQLSHGLLVEFGTVDSGKTGRVLKQDGTDFLTDVERVYISLRNRAPRDGGSTIHVSVFDINVAGEVTLVSLSWPKGIDIPPERSVLLREGDDFELLEGLAISWPNNVPRERPVSEEIVVVVTSSPVDLGGLAGRLGCKDSTGRNKLSALEEFAAQILSGTTRNVQEARTTSVKFDVIHIPFTLVSSTLPDPAEQRELSSLPQPMQVTAFGEGDEILFSKLPPPEATPGYGLLAEETANIQGKVSLIIVQELTYAP